MTSLQEMCTSNMASPLLARKGRDAESADHSVCAAVVVGLARLRLCSTEIEALALVACGDLTMFKTSIGFLGVTGPAIAVLLWFSASSHQFIAVGDGVRYGLTDEPFGGAFVLLRMA